eukprot:1160623-Pelagomonas_calceolata.AAC.12
MQTDPVEWAAAADDEEEEEDAGLGQQVHVGGLDWLPTDAALGPKHQNRGEAAGKRFGEIGALHAGALDRVVNGKGRMMKVGESAKLSIAWAR